MIERPSPNFGLRPAGGPIDMLILHYTGMASAAAALDRLCDPGSGVSAHYVIDEDGAVHHLVDEAMRAWHAGVACWAGDTDINDRSIGIELVNPGHEFGYRPFPRPQVAALEALACDVLARHPIPPRRVLGHSDVAPGRKADPGEMFDWRLMAGRGIGVWPATGDGAAGCDTATARRLLAGYGYRLDGGEKAFAEVVTAFQRHFRPERVDGVVDAETFDRLSSLCAAQA